MEQISARTGNGVFERISIRYIPRVEKSHPSPPPPHLSPKSSSKRYTHPGLIICLSTIAWSQVPPPQLPSCQSGRGSSTPCRQAPSHCALPNNQIQPPHPRRPRVLSRGTKGTQFSFYNLRFSKNRNPPLKQPSPRPFPNCSYSTLLL